VYECAIEKARPATVQQLRKSAGIYCVEAFYGNYGIDNVGIFDAGVLESFLEQQLKSCANRTNKIIMMKKNLRIFFLFFCGLRCLET
jgi:hypothetical protein